MLAEVELENFIEEGKEEMPSLNHSILYNKILRQLFENDKVEALPELTLDIGKGIIPDISVYPKEKVPINFRRDISKFSEMPILAIEVISSSQNIQDLLEKADILIENGVKAVWTVEPFSNTVFVTTKNGEEIIHNQVVETEGIKVDFKKIFG